MDQTSENLFFQTKILIQRLERISADSVWAHRVSGVRGALLRCVENWQAGELDEPRLRYLLDVGFDYLYKAAREIPDILE